MLGLRSVVAAAFCVLSMQAAAIDASNRYRSPRNPERAIRRSTELIVLHTTEAPARSSLNKLSERGEAHFCVTEDGSVYRIVDRDREAYHAGRSMWNGKEDVDKFSIGIECVGHHDKPMPAAEIAAIRALVKDLKAMYHLTDDKVICHSHVAYGAPNKWHKCKHRGRKRCGMLFAMPSVRRALGLKLRPALDPDTRAKRLKVADDYLNRVLYSNIDTMAKYYGKNPVPIEGAKASWLTRFFTRKKEEPPKPVAKTPSKPGAKPTSIAQLKAGGYVQKGVVSKDQTARKIAGDRWNSAQTYYTIRDKVIPGTAIDPAHIERGMAIWMK